MESSTPTSAQPAAKSGPEARREERIPVNKIIQVLPCKPQQQWKFVKAELVNCSRNGLAMRYDQRMQPNEQFLVKLKLGAVQLLVYTVRYCLAQGRDFMIGAEFVGLSAAPFKD